MGSSRTSQLMVVDEGTPGLVVTPSLGIPVVSFTPTVEDGQTASEAIIASRRFLAEWQSNGGNLTVKAAAELEATARGFGFWLKHGIGPGAVNTTGPTSSFYTHTLTPGSSDGYAFTAQAGIADDAGTQPFTLAGAKVKELGLAWDVGDKVNLSVDMVAQRAEHGSRTLTSCATTNGETTVVVTGATADLEGATLTHANLPTGTWVVAVNSATSITVSAAATADGTGLSIVVGKALATVSYQSTGQKLFKAMHAHVTVAGTEVSIYGGSEKIVNPIDEVDFRSGSKWSKEQKDNGELAEVSGDFECEYSAALYRRYLAGEKFTLVRQFTNGTDQLTLTSRARITPGAEPKIDGRSRNRMTVPWMALGDTDADALTAVLVTRDATL